MSGSPIIAVSGYLIIAAFWLIPVLALAGYFFTRRGLRRSRYLLAFDLFVLVFGAVAFRIAFSTAFTRTPSYEERLVGYYTLPLAISLIFVPLLLIAAVVRYFIFSKSPAEATHAP